jgi:radical SAM superfamily enzyme YgiQ (UPF0313 family)
MRTVLVTRHADARFPPLALLYLKSVLVDATSCGPDDVTLLEFGPEAEPHDVASAILSAESDILALSCYVWNVTTLMRAAQLVASARPDMLVVAGGPEVGPDGARALSRYPAVDVVVKGEGERAMVELAERWTAGKEMEDVPGIWHRTASGFCEHPDNPPLADLDSLASPHARGYFDHVGRIACVETQRGCPFGCRFCYYGKGLRAEHRTFGLARLEAELGFWLEQDVAQVFLMDPVFNLDAPRAKAICRFLIGRNHRRIPMHAEIRAELVDDELAALMKAAHFDYLEIGLQAIDDTTLATVGRRSVGAAFVAGIERLRAHALPFEVQVIFGLPGDTPASHAAAIDFAAALRPEYLSSFTLMVLPGTPLREAAARLELAYDPEPPYYVRRTPTMDENAVRQGRRKNPALRFLWNASAVRWVHSRHGVAMSELLTRWDAWSAAAGLAAVDLPTSASARTFAFAVCQELGVAPDFDETVTRAEAEPCLRRLARVVGAR